MKLSLSPETERLIAEKVDSGRYHSADEVVRECLKLLDERDNGGRPALEKNAVPEQVEPAAEKAEKVTDLVELFDRIRRTVPDSEWEKLPRDLAANYEHYLYGSPKQS
jgi:antitoxin ParD1/3/4